MIWVLVRVLVVLIILRIFQRAEPLLLFRRPVGLQIVVIRNAFPVIRAKLALAISNREHLRHVAVVAPVGRHRNDLLVLGIPEMDTLVTISVSTNPNHVAVVRLRVVCLQDLVGPLQLLLLLHLVDARKLVVFLVQAPNAQRAVLVVLIIIIKDYESCRHS